MSLRNVREKNFEMLRIIPEEVWTVEIFGRFAPKRRTWLKTEKQIREMLDRAYKSHPSRITFEFESVFSCLERMVEMYEIVAPCKVASLLPMLEEARRGKRRHMFTSIHYHAEWMSRKKRKNRTPKRWRY